MPAESRQKSAWIRVRASPVSPPSKGIECQQHQKQCCQAAYDASCNGSTIVGVAPADICRRPCACQDKCARSLSRLS
jgi:hypothetical protein